MERNTIFMDRKTEYSKHFSSPKSVYRRKYDCNKNVGSIFGQFTNLL